MDIKVTEMLCRTRSQLLLLDVDATGKRLLGHFQKEKPVCVRFSCWHSCCSSLLLLLLLLLSVLSTLYLSALSTWILLEAEMCQDSPNSVGSCQSGSDLRLCRIRLNWLRCDVQGLDTRTFWFNTSTGPTYLCFGDRGRLHHGPTHQDGLEL